jgi:hypothetical protein
MLYALDTPSTLSVEVREVLKGFRVRDTAALGLSELYRVQLLGKCTDFDAITWIISTIRTHTFFEEHEPQCTPSPVHRIGEYTSCIALPRMRSIPFLPA